MPVIPFGEWRPDVSDYNGQHTLRAENVFPRGDGYGPVPSLAPYTDALPSACRGAFIALKSDGTINIFAGTATRLYKLRNTDLTWEDVTRGSDGNILLEDGESNLLLESGSNLLLEGFSAASTYSLAAADNWQFAQLADVVLATNKSDLLQSYTMGSSTAFANCAGSPPQAAYITTVNQFVVLSGLSANPNRLQWCGRSDSTIWDSVTSESNQQDFTDGGVVRGVAGGEFGLVLQDNAVREMIYQPGTSIIFSFNRIAEGKGLRNPYSLIKAGDRVFFRSAAGFEMLIPGSVPVPIGKERFDRFFEADLDSGNLQLFIGAYEPESSRVYWAYKSNIGAAGLFNKIIVWDFVLQRAALITGISGEYIAQLGQPGVTLEGLDSISSSIDALSVSFDNIPASFGVQLAMFSSAHKAGFLSGTNLEATIETAEYADGNARKFIRSVRPATDDSAVAGSILTRDRLVDGVTTSAEQTLNGVGYFPFRKDTRLIKYRNRHPAAGVWTFDIGVEPDSVATGQK